MPVDRKLTRSAVKNSDEKSTEELSVLVPREKSPTSPANIGARSSEELFMSDAVLTRFAELVSVKINSNFETLIKKLEANQKECETKINALRSENSYLRHQLDKQEQYSRRNNVRIYGIPVVTKTENTDEIILKLLAEKMNIVVPVDAIDRSHRLRTNNDKNPPPIIAKFATYRVRALVLNNKKLLKGTGITINEDLTSMRASLRRMCAEKWGHQKVWTRDGVILIKAGEAIYKVENEEQLLQIQ